MIWKNWIYLFPLIFSRQKQYPVPTTRNATRAIATNISHPFPEDCLDKKVRMISNQNGRIWLKRHKCCSRSYKNNGRNMSILSRDLICPTDYHYTAVQQLVISGLWCVVIDYWFSRTKECSNYYKSNEQKENGRRSLKTYKEGWNETNEWNITMWSRDPIRPPGYHSLRIRCTVTNCLRTKECSNCHKK